MAFAIMVHPMMGAAATVKRMRLRTSVVCQPFDGAVLESPQQFEQWTCDSRVEADAMADKVRRVCPLACVSVVTA